jgi:hypothetical protein
LNQHLIERLEGIRRTLVEQWRAGQTLPSAAKGDERETFIREFLSKVFPPHYRFGTGAVTDSAGECSGQIDIAIELPFSPSFSVPPGDVRLYLAEGIGAIIEVKSNLASQWEEVVSTTEKVKKLTRNFGSTISFGNPPPPQIPVFAAGYEGCSSIDTIKQRLDKTDVAVRPDGVLVLDPGLFVGGGIEETGPLALYGLIVLVNSVCTSVISIRPDYLAYARWKSNRA